MVAKTTATAVQKENFKLKFAEIIKNNSNLRDQYSIQFFETAQKKQLRLYRSGWKIAQHFIEPYFRRNRTIQVAEKHLAELSLKAF